MKKTDEELLKIAYERVEFKKHLITYLVINIAIWIFWYLTTPDGYIWPIWVSLGWGIGIVSHFTKTYVRNSNQVQKEFEKLKRKQEERNI